MPARRSSNLKICLMGCMGLLPMVALGACADYVKHSDTITASAGDAITHNKVVHIDDPWPRASANTRITGNGQRVDRVTKRYLSGGAAPSLNSISVAPQITNSPSPQGAPPPQ
jgi:hypothetical protein